MDVQIPKLELGNPVEWLHQRVQSTIKTFEIFSTIQENL
jgi:hypothetical protein